MSDMTMEEAQRQLWAAVRKLTEAGYTLKAPLEDVVFSVAKPDGWRRHEVVCVFGDQRLVIERFWSWDRADNLAQRLGSLWKILRGQA